MVFVVTIPDDATAEVDRDDLTRILDNLLSNAVEVTVGGGRVEITFARPGALRFTDDGPGVSEAVAGTLFDPFVSTKAEGLGLGLWLSRTLAEASGGALDHEGPSAFVLTLRNGAAA